MNIPADVTVTQDGTQVTVAGRGALDLSNAQQFKAELENASLSAEHVVADLREATFIDTAILTYLVTAARNLQQRGKRLTVMTRENTHPLRTLTVVGFQTVMDVVVEPKDTDK